MKQYRELKTLTEVAQAMDAGLNVERICLNCELPTWLTLTNTYIESLATHKYRIEIEAPKQGDEILVWNDNSGMKVRRKFIAFYEGEVVTKSTMAVIEEWSTWKWPEEEKPEAREGWVYATALYETRDKARPCVYVREITGESHAK